VLHVLLALSCCSSVSPRRLCHCRLVRPDRQWIPPALAASLTSPRANHLLLTPFYAFVVSTKCSRYREMPCLWSSTRAYRCCGACKWSQVLCERNEVGRRASSGAACRTSDAHAEPKVHLSNFVLRVCGARRTWSLSTALAAVCNSHANVRALARGLASS
jgi:hypothetical protein